MLSQHAEAFVRLRLAALRYAGVSNKMVAIADEDMKGALGARLDFANDSMNAATEELVTASLAFAAAAKPALRRARRKT